MPFKGSTITRPCMRCGKPVTRLVSQTRSDRLICGRECSKNRGTVACKVCGTTFESRLSRRHRRSYCSDACRDQRAKSPEARFWKYVDKNGPTQPHCPELGACWMWTGDLLLGYGRLTTWDRSSGTRGTIRAHRLSLEMKLGRALVEGEYALHHCDVRQCVNPDHLYAGDQTDNVRDAVARGRIPSGDANPLSKLTDSQKSEIRAKYALGGLRQIDLAAEYGVTQTFISRVVRRQ